MAKDQAATIYRMVLPEHACPFGVQAKQLLEQHGFAVEDHVLTTRAEVEAFKAEQGIQTTPLVFIDNKPIGGSEDLERYLTGS